MKILIQILRGGTVKNVYQKSISPFNARLTLLFALVLMVAALGPQLHASNYYPYGVEEAMVERRHPVRVHSCRAGDEISP